MAFKAIVYFPIWRSEPLFQFGVLSHFFHLAFRVAFSFRHPVLSLSIWHSGRLFQFDVQSCLFHLAFRAASSFRHPMLSRFFHLAFRTSILVWHSKPTFTFLVWHSEPSPLISLAFRAIITSQSRRSEPLFLLSFGIQSHYFFSVSAFRAIITYQFWRSEPLFLLSLGVQSRHHFLSDARSHHLFSVPAFRATTSFQFGIQSHICTLAFRAVSHSRFDARSCTLISTSIAITIFSLVLSFRAAFRTHSSILIHYL